ncbi:hypothetical protein ACFM35_01885 [Microbacterium sp. P01]|uniref:hypothetical protein n=1 Tax=unclassified Microbacterium TaxID=2609290 RepID=UPI00366D59CF
MDLPQEAWSEFNVAMVGATAALAGLVIVAASVNIADIVKASSLTSRLASGISSLVLAIVGSAVGLVPGLGLSAYGIIMIAGALVAAVFAGAATRRIAENRHPENRLRALKAALGFAAPLSYVVGGLLLLTDAPAGLAWFAAGSLIAIIAALLISWIVLVEVLR